MLTRDKIKDLHFKYAQNTDLPDLYFELVWTHSEIVAKIAQRIAKSITFAKIDLDLIQNGALVHDIGMYLCYDNELNKTCKTPPLHHGFLGTQILEKEEIGIDLQRFCLTHTAVGLTLEDVVREELPIEAKDYLPVSVEEEIVCYADKFHTKYPSFSSFDEISKRLEKFDPQRKIHLDIFRRKYGIPELADLAAKYSEWSLDINRRIEKAMDSASFC